MFGSVFVLVWGGASIVTVNAQLLGGTISFFQSVCVVGYCLFPLVLAAFLGVLISHSAFRLVAAATALLWSMRASVVFMSSLVSERRRALAVFPLCLFYLVIAWLVYVS